MRIKKSLSILGLLLIAGVTSCGVEETTPQESPTSVISSESSNPISNPSSSSSSSTTSQKNDEPQPSPTTTPTSTNPTTSNTTPTSTTSEKPTPTSNTTPKPTPLPTTTDNSPKGYYANVNTTLKDEDFRRDLSKTINLGFIHKTYADAYKIIAESDEDPNDSSSCICLYTGRSIKKDDHSNSTGYNREHVWAKSHGFKDESSSNPYCDVHHLRVTGMTINSTRSNSDFYEFGSNETYSISGENKYTGDRFEPRDEVKGDVARMMFYMATMYGFDGKYNLTLTEDKTTSASNGNGKFGNVATLVKWALEDPVSSAEIYRNEVVYKYQHNRNPYIDHPEYVSLAYAKYASSIDEIEVNETKVADSIAMIDSLPEEITLDDKNQVMEALNFYNSLNYKEKALVTNVNKLTAAVNKIKELEKPVGGDDIVISEGDCLLDFTQFPKLGAGYKSNISQKMGDYEVICNVGFCDGKEFRLGYNAKAASNAKYTINGKEEGVAVLYVNSNFKNLSSIDVISNHCFEPITYKIYFTSDDINFEEITSGQLGKYENETKTISAKLDTPKDGHFVIAVSGGQTCRFAISKIVIKVSE